jgi:hypothetical protein
MNHYLMDTLIALPACPEIHTQIRRGWDYPPTASQVSETIARVTLTGGIWRTRDRERE